MNKWLHTYFISFLNIIYLLHWLQLPSICIVTELSTHQGVAASVWCIIAISPLFGTIRWPHSVQMWDVNISENGLVDLGEDRGKHQWSTLIQVKGKKQVQQLSIFLLLMPLFMTSNSSQLCNLPRLQLLHSVWICQYPHTLSSSYAFQKRSWESSFI